MSVQKYNKIITITLAKPHHSGNISSKQCWRRHRNPMGMVKLRPLVESKPLNRLRKNFAQLITSTRQTYNPKICDNRL